jgi:repressor LexA
VSDQGEAVRERMMAFVLFYTDEHRYPPTVREIGKAVGLTSSSTVHVHLRILQHQGRLRTAPGKARTLTLVPQEGAPLA